MTEKSDTPKTPAPPAAQTAQLSTPATKPARSAKKKAPWKSAKEYLPWAFILVLALIMGIVGSLIGDLIKGPPQPIFVSEPVSQQTTERIYFSISNEGAPVVKTPALKKGEVFFVDFTDDNGKTSRLRLKPESNQLRVQIQNR